MRSQFCPGSNDSLAVAKTWLKDCLEHHAGVCTWLPSIYLKWVPTRLIEIGDRKLCLRKFDHQRAEISYFILSYCRSTERKDEIKLTREKETQFLRSIEFNDLSRTVADAIVVTRKQGYHYLWVDRLCIIQGDDND